jgi:hypothetical protein
MGQWGNKRKTAADGGNKEGYQGLTGDKYTTILDSFLPDMTQRWQALSLFLCVRFWAGLLNGFPDIHSVCSRVFHLTFTFFFFSFYLISRSISVAFKILFHRTFAIHGLDYYHVLRRNHVSVIWAASVYFHWCMEKNEKQTSIAFFFPSRPSRSIAHCRLFIRGASSRMRKPSLSTMMPEHMQHSWEVEHLRVTACW